MYIRETLEGCDNNFKNFNHNLQDWVYDVKLLRLCQLS